MANRAALAERIGQAGFRDCAEIGVYDGKYSEVICRNVPNVRMICVDTWLPSRNHRNLKKVEQAFEEARRRLSPYDVYFFQMTSLEAARQMEDQSLDFVYIDALHDFTNVTADLNAWVPKVRVGGVVAGHDWGHKGVTSAVNTYLQLHAIAPLYTTLPSEDDCMPSWAWVKKSA